MSTEQRDDPDFPPVGTVRYELHGARCIQRVEIVAICESRAEARQWMLDHESEWRGRQR